jgi:putative oxidoreductase
MGGAMHSSGASIIGANAAPLKRGTVRRSFSAFPDGSPGQGLLLLRVIVGLPLVYRGIADLAPPYLTSIPELAAAVAGIFMISGLYTPVAVAVIVLAEAWMVFSPAFAHDGERLLRILLALVSTSVAMLGPGAWSMDARRFGRKVFEIGGSAPSKD